MNIKDLAGAILHLIIINPNYYTNYFMGLGYDFLVVVGLIFSFYVSSIKNPAFPYLDKNYY